MDGRNEGAHHGSQMAISIWLVFIDIDASDFIQWGYGWASKQWAAINL